MSPLVEVCSLVSACGVLHGVRRWPYFRSSSSLTLASSWAILSSWIVSFHLAASSTGSNQQTRSSRSNAGLGHVVFERLVDVAAQSVLKDEGQAHIKVDIN
jgi:hypothetical protein